jgi:hypothetical protein
MFAVSLFSVLALSAITPSDGPSTANALLDSGGASQTADQLSTPGSEAQASLVCDPGWYECGVSHCTPDGGVCCASVGDEEHYCPGGFGVLRG